MDPHPQPAKAYRTAPITLPDTNATLAEALARGLPMLDAADGDTDAVLQVFANRKLEKAALAAVAPDVRERYERLAETFEEAPRVHLGLQLDLLQGKLAENSLLRGIKPGPDGAVDWSAITLEEAAVGWLRGKVADADRYGEQKLGAPWAEQPVAKAPTPDDVVAAKLANDAFLAPKLQAAYGKLPSEPKARYDRVMAVLAGHAGAARRVEAMLVDGRMTGNKDLKGGATLLENLERLATQPLVPELAPHRADLLAAVVREIHEPAAVVQRDRYACGGAALQGFIAANNPSEYARLVVGLAGPEGKASLQNGGLLKRDAYWLGAMAEGLTYSALLIQPAFAHRGATARFAMKQVATPVAGLDEAMPGMSPHAVAGVLGELTGLERRPVWREPGAALTAHEGASPFRPVPALINYASPEAAGGVAPRWVAITAVDKAKGTVTYRTQLGREEAVGRAEFERHVYAVVVPGSASGLA